MTTAIKQNKIQSHEIVNDAPRTFTDADFPVGSVAHQGDVILVRIESLPESRRDRANRQLADGNTQGSRHVLVEGFVYDCDRGEVADRIQDVCPKAELIADDFIGPVFLGGELTHPEHGNHHYADDMVIATVYQRTVDVLDRIERVQD